MSRITELNDSFRRSLEGGRVMFTAGVSAMDAASRAMALSKVRTFETFAKDNDPHGEHDFGSFDLAGQKFFWKLDYFAPDLEHGSEDPSDPAKTTRVLTIMLAEEY